MRNSSRTGFSLLQFSSSSKPKTRQAEPAAEKMIYFVIPSEARNRSSIQAQEKKERFLTSLGMTKKVGAFPASSEACPTLAPEHSEELPTVARATKFSPCWKCQQNSGAR
jgi:hypothetical protein